LQRRPGQFHTVCRRNVVAHLLSNIAAVVIQRGLDSHATSPSWNWIVSSPTRILVSRGPTHTDLPGPSSSQTRPGTSRTQPSGTGPKITTASCSGGYLAPHSSSRPHMASWSGRPRISKWATRSKASWRTCPSSAISLRILESGVRETASLPSLYQGNIRRARLHHLGVPAGPQDRTRYRQVPAPVRKETVNSVYILLAPLPSLSSSWLHKDAALISNRPRTRMTKRIPQAHRRDSPQLLRRKTESDQDEDASGDRTIISTAEATTWRTPCTTKAKAPWSRYIGNLPAASPVDYRLFQRYGATLLGGMESKKAP
jgi:hypothetical protein